MRELERSNELTKRAISKSVVLARLLLTVYINLKYFKVPRPYFFIYTDITYILFYYLF